MESAAGAVSGAAAEFAAELGPKGRGPDPQLLGARAGRAAVLFVLDLLDGSRRPASWNGTPRRGVSEALRRLLVSSVPLKADRSSCPVFALATLMSATDVS